MPSRAGAPLFADPLRGRPPGVRNHGNPARATTPEIADHRLLGLSAERSVRTRLAGIFLFWPLLAQIGFDRLVQQAHYPGSEMIPAVSALLSLLMLKLLDKERRSHINDFNFDEALGLFAGLNVLPKKSFATDYSYRCQHIHQQQLLRGWISQLSPLLFPQADTFNLDFHPIPYRGDTEGLDNHYLPRRGKAGLSVLTFFAQEHKSRIICYGNANLTLAEQDSEVLRFVDFWQALSAAAILPGCTSIPSSPAMPSCHASTSVTSGSSPFDDAAPASAGTSTRCLRTLGTGRTWTFPSGFTKTSAMWMKPFVWTTSKASYDKSLSRVWVGNDTP